MILPKNGKIVIFDDQYEAVKGLMAALSKEQIPYLYYQDEGGEDLPNSPIKNVRVVFLDLELVTGQSVSEHAITSAIGGRLERVLEKDNNYILVYWSTKQDKYQKMLEEAFEDRLKEFKPIIALSLNKAEALRHTQNTIEFILNEIESKSEDFKLFRIFTLWENLINDSAGLLINDFTNFIDNDANWDNGAKFVLYKLAQAYSGKTTNKKSEPDQLQDAFFTLNYTFIDAIENLVLTHIRENEESLKGLISSEGITAKDYSSVINRRLLISKMDIAGVVPGGLFFTDEDIDKQRQKLIGDLERVKSNDRIPEDQRGTAIANAELKYKDQMAGIDSTVAGLSKNYNSIVNAFIQVDDPEERKQVLHDIINDSIKIELNISPLCDFAQEKMPCVRLLPGLLLSAKHLDKINTKNTYNYFSDGVIRFKENDYKLAFDFRYLYSRPESLLRSRISNYKLRHQLLSDIQLKLGSHVNRSGVLFVQ